MTPAFLYFANLVLLTRCWCLLKEGGARPGVWLVKLAIELAGLLAFQWHSWWFAAAATVVIANVAGILWEALGWRKNTGHVVMGILYLLVLSVWFSPEFGLGFRPELVVIRNNLSGWTSFGRLLDGLLTTRRMLLLFGLLVSANEVNLLIRALFDHLGLKPRAAAGGEDYDHGEYNRGRVIGILERALIYFFILFGQYGAIGFTLAAKAFTRFKELEDRRFAEYVLIGTLLSSGLAMAVGVVVRLLLR